MAFVYILECADGTYYVGSTRLLEARVWQHQSGEGAAYTRHRLPVRLIWSAEFEHVGAAFAFEKQVQGWGRRKREALIRGDWDALPGLASRAWRHRGAGFETGAGAPSSTSETPSTVEEVAQATVSKPPPDAGFETGASAPSSTSETPSVAEEVAQATVSKPPNDGQRRPTQSSAQNGSQ